jgi:hypothetical protein
LDLRLEKASSNKNENRNAVANFFLAEAAKAIWIYLFTFAGSIDVADFG